MRTFFFGLVVLFVSACGGVNAGECQPACGSGQLCCSEPTHGANDGGFSAWVCVTTSGPTCPLYP